MRIVHMAIEHIYLRIVMLIQAILTVIAHHRIVAQNHLSFVIVPLLIRLNPLKTGRIKIPVIQKPIVISRNQIQLSVQLRQKLVGLRAVSE